MDQRTRPCELCAGEAAVYCDSDAAYLCWDCDAAVHGANFLVARHVRRVACATCRSFDDGAHCVSGAGPRPPALAALCHSCDPRPTCPLSPSASSSSCLSTSESTAVAPPRELAGAKRRRRPRRAGADGGAEDVLLCWCRGMGLPRRRRSVAAVAAAAFEGVVVALPFRVALAAALWFAIKRGEEDAPVGGGRGAALRRLEACSGVPARLIVVAESRIARSAGRVRVVEEGWAECS